MKKFIKENKGMLIFIGIVIVVLSVIGIVDNSTKTYTYQGSTELITLDGVRIEVPWSVEYTWWVIVPKDHMEGIKVELKQMCDKSVRDALQVEYPFIDFFNHNVEYNFDTPKYPYWLSYRPTIDTLYKNGLVNVNEDHNWHFMMEHGVTVEQYFLNQMRTGEYK